MSRLLILTGPQGSGNHLFSKCFAVHEDVFGWKSLLNTYWEGHHHEPFASAWTNPDELHSFDWTQSEFFVTSVSCPYFKDQQPHIPFYERFIKVAEQYVDSIDVAIIGRDQTILKHQQERVRGSHTTQLAIDHFNWLTENTECKFLSQELLYLYKQKYLEQISRELDWPIAYWDPDIDTILKEDANKKYIKEVHEYWLDFEVHRAIRES
tara:strand:+ start:455 stop:1081 length:627 start_codon:yes stop_codon:yes gene_type:complete